MQSAAQCWSFFTRGCSDAQFAYTHSRSWRAVRQSRSCGPTPSTPKARSIRPSTPAKAFDIVHRIVWGCALYKYNYSDTGEAMTLASKTRVDKNGRTFAGSQRQIQTGIMWPVGIGVGSLLTLL